MSTPSLRYSIFGQPRPNELVWGWLGRFLDRYPGISHDALAEMIGELPSYRKLFPTRLASLAEVAGMTPDELLAGHTCHNFAAIELSASQGQALGRAMLTSNALVHVPDRLAVRSQATLRVCHSCIADDLRETGCTYYRCNHQVREVMRCSKHGSPLFETEVTLGERAYTSPQVASKKGVALNHSCSASLLVAKGYEFFAAKKSHSADQITPVLQRVLETRGFLRGGRVSETLRSHVEGFFGGDSLGCFGFHHHEIVRDWVTVPSLILVLNALGIDWDGFMMEVGRVEVPEESRAPLTARQQELLGRIQKDGQIEARDLRSAGKKVTVWALATALSRRYAMSFASNYCWRPEFRMVLLAHAKAA